MVTMIIEFNGIFRVVLRERSKKLFPDERLIKEWSGQNEVLWAVAHDACKALNY